MVSVAGLMDKTTSDARVVDTESRVGVRSKASLPVPQDNTGSEWLPAHLQEVPDFTTAHRLALW